MSSEKVATQRELESAAKYSSGLLNQVIDHVHLTGSDYGMALEMTQARDAAAYAAGAASVDVKEAERRGYERALDELDAEALSATANCGYGRPSNSEAYCIAATLLRSKLAKGGKGG